MTKRYEKGDVVFIRAIRYPDGSGTGTVSKDHPAWDSYPVNICFIAQVDVAGLDGCYGLEWADDKAPVGLPFWATSFCNAAGQPLEQ